MKICFLNPPYKTRYGKFSRESRSPSVSSGGALYYPLWLIYAAALAEQSGHPTVFLDACAEGLGAEETLQYLKSRASSCGLFVIDTSTPSIENDLKCAGKIRCFFPSAFILLVGPHVSALPEETLKKCSAANAVARQEYDETVSDLSSSLETGKPLSDVPGITWRDRSGTIVSNPPREYINDPDRIPFASEYIRRHLKTEQYLFPAALFPSVQIFTGRGCPCRCTFCVYPQTMFGHTYRTRSDENVAAEFAWIKKNMPEVKEIVIEDDTFTADTERVKRICSLLIRRNIRMRWLCNARVTLDYETMRLMKKAGCHLIIPGVESCDDGILKRIRKGTSAEQIEQYMKNAKKAGLKVHACYMAGNPGETEETLKKTLRAAIRFNTDSAQFYPMTPYPGTEIYDWAVKNGALKKELSYRDWLNQDGSLNAVVSLPGLSASEIERFCAAARKKYYLRPRYLLSRIGSGIRDPRDFLRAVRLFFNMLKSGGFCG
jgi:anaerobic magnesium-protoporphyrin IX monomethyl ester cyclase